MGVLRKTGEKRATKYFTAEEAGAVELPRKPGKQRRDLRTVAAAGVPSEPPR